ncbi:hypothetical protein RFF05_14225 [Bengtsoniella intestinalis]|uniref:hypothetical protein n=1 Tax=Bengtsoniella intestinalis TaxID=3073143 RepID=UPI00391F1F32
MTDIKQDLQQIQTLLSDAFAITGSLVCLPSYGQSDPEQRSQLLSKIATHFEQATLQVRNLCERHTTLMSVPGKPTLEPIQMAGLVELIEDQWLHIRLNGLLPHCRYKTPSYLTDTMRRLLDDYERQGGKLPYFEQAVLVLDEHSNIEGRHIYDQDNKGWKAVSNAIKGRLVLDDDQYHLGVVLLSKTSTESVCHITILRPQDLPDFFALREFNYTTQLLYRGF